jgi:Flp pilus assembly protein CpaB
MRTVSEYDPQRLGAQLGNAVRKGAPPDEVAELQAKLRVGQIELRIRKVLDGAEPLTEEAAHYLVSLVVKLSVRGRPGGGRGD